jgi:acyl dehydratase
MFKEQIGKQSHKVKNVVERGAVKKFAAAIGDLHPIFFNEEVGKQSKFKGNIAPPTFPRVFDYGVLEELKLPSKGLIHGEQAFHYVRPLLVGEEVYCYLKVKDYFEKKGNFGEMGFLVLESNGEDPEGNTIFRSTSTIVISEAVRKVLAR